MKDKVNTMTKMEDGKKTKQKKNTTNKKLILADIFWMKPFLSKKTKI